MRSLEGTEEHVEYFDQIVLSESKPEDIENTITKLITDGLTREHAIRRVISKLGPCSEKDIRRLL